jgi:hypothetical protein
VKENSTKAVAAAVAVGLAGLAWVLRLQSEEGKFEVVEQRVVPFHPGAEPPSSGVQFQLRFPKSLAERNLSIKVADKAGNQYPVLGAILPDGRFTVPIGYDKPVVEPRVEAFNDTKLVATRPLAPFPDPERHPLTPREDSRFQLALRKGDSKRGQKDVLELTSSVTPPKGEVWKVQVIGTEFGGEMAVDAELGGGNVWRLPLPYPSSTGAIQIRVTKERSELKHEDIPIDGMILVQRYGQTGVSVPEERTFPNHLGLTIRLPKQETGPNRPSKHEDLRAASVDLQIDAEPGTPTPSTALVSPKAEELGLKSLAIGAATSKHEPNPGTVQKSGSPFGFGRGPMPVGGPPDSGIPSVKTAPTSRVPFPSKAKIGPFRAVVRIFKEQREKLGSFDMVLAVHPGKPLPPPPPPAPMTSGATSAAARPQGYTPEGDPIQGVNP